MEENKTDADDRLFELMTMPRDPVEVRLVRMFMDFPVKNGVAEIEGPEFGGVMFIKRIGVSQWGGRDPGSTPFSGKIKLRSDDSRPVVEVDFHGKDFVCRAEDLVVLDRKYKKGGLSSLQAELSPKPEGFRPLNVRVDCYVTLTPLPEDDAELTQ